MSMTRILAAAFLVLLTLSGIPARSATEAVVYSFKGPPDAGQSQAALINVNGTLYGTSNSGGDPADDGTVFSLQLSGNAKVLHKFGSGNDGVGPDAALLNVKGTLYGTTVQGGNYSCSANGCGIVFSITPTGIEKILHSFGGIDGSMPFSGLIVGPGGFLYGTTLGGGSGGLGTVFMISTAGKYRVIHSFAGGSDGEHPAAALIDVNGTLYGTTLGGGAGRNCSPEGGISGCGTVFSVTPSGVEKIVYSFKGAADGQYPQAGLINVGGTFYGTTRAGGQAGCVDYCGTVYSVTPGGIEKVLHVFGSGSDGYAPVAPLIKFGNLLWGTCADGAVGVSTGGTVFSITTAGIEKVVHAFQAAGDGFGPEAGLLGVGGALYGTTLEGGANQLGTVFKITP